ncbi:MAG TPA: TRC40/GET3/ArsA family transport-energizing ATPase [Solirubrobacteraceae bacterium]|nr:TRC40/GET3/ArsA family transport-energizing ATPase [Solirubrobacteraceae bacterium]
MGRPRTILYTGKGGVGKTSVAACTARGCAAAGHRTLVISTDPAHSLSESLGADLGADPVQAGDGLWGQEVKAQEEMERHWSGVQEWLGELLVERGVDRISAEELTVPPGGDELFALLRLQAHHESGDWDVIIVDCAPTGETLRLLSFPDVARWWIDKVFPFERQLMAAARPIARSLLDISLPGRAVFSDIERLSQNLIAMNEILRDRSHSTIRLVMNPDRMVIGEAMRTFTYLNLYGYLTDAVIVNRLFPDGVGEYFADWRRVQEEHLERVHSAFAPLPVLCAPYFEQEVVGPEMLDRLRHELFADADPADVLHDALAQELEVLDRGARLRLDLPFAEKGDISLKKIGLELVVGVDGQRRTIMLPPAMAAMRPAAATFEGGALEIRFDGEQ